MASRKTKIRRKLFDLYAANIRFFEPEHAGRFVCPICGRVYNEGALDPANLLVDIAHVFPRSCGGRLATLACRDCNSHVGARHESHLARCFQLWDALSGHGQGKVNARVQFATGESLGVEVSRRGDHYHFQHIPDQCNPQDQKSIVRHAVNGEQFNFTMTTRGFEPHRTGVAMLHAAYLSMFRHFGYEYLFRADTQWLRDVAMMDDAPDPVPMYSMCLKRDATQMPAERLINTIGAYTTQEGLTTFAVALPSPDPRDAATIVFMPGFGSDGKQAYEELVKLGDRPLYGQYNVYMDDPATRLADPGHSVYGRWLWLKLSGQLDGRKS